MQSPHKREGYAQNWRRQTVQLRADFADQVSSFHPNSPSVSAFCFIGASVLVQSSKYARRGNFALQMQTICRKL